VGQDYYLAVLVMATNINQPEVILSDQTSSRRRESCKGQRRRAFGRCFRERRRSTRSSSDFRARNSRRLFEIVVTGSRGASPFSARRSPRTRRTETEIEVRCKRGRHKRRTPAHEDRGEREGRWDTKEDIFTWKCPSELRIENTPPAVLWRSRPGAVLIRAGQSRSWRQDQPELLLRSGNRYAPPSNGVVGSAPNHIAAHEKEGDRNDADRDNRVVVAAQACDPVP